MPVRISSQVPCKLSDTALIGRWALLIEVVGAVHILILDASDPVLVGGAVIGNPVAYWRKYGICVEYCYVSLCQFVVLRKD